MMYNVSLWLCETGTAAERGKKKSFLNHKILCVTMNVIYLLLNLWKYKKGGPGEKRGARVRFPIITVNSSVQKAYVLQSTKSCNHLQMEGLRPLYAQEAFVVNSPCQGQIPEAPSELRCYHSASILPLTPKGKPPRPIALQTLPSGALK